VVITRRSIAVVLAAASAALAADALAAPRPKVVILGFDGADARLVEQWMGEGKLPNLARLRDEGSYSPLQPTNPPQTPVSWSSFATGTTPGKTKIFDWLVRDPATYLPDIGMVVESRRNFLFGSRNGVAAGLVTAGLLFMTTFVVLALAGIRWRIRLAVAGALGVAAGIPAGFVAARVIPVEVPSAVNRRSGATMWQLAARAGLKAQVIHVPATFPADDVGDGNMLSGLGVPDMRGRIGTPAFYTSNPAFTPGADGNEFSLEFIRLSGARGTITSTVVGPANKPFFDYVVDRKTAGIADPRARADARLRERQALDDAGVRRRIDLPFTIVATDTEASITLDGRAQTLHPGEWSDWYTLRFPVNGLVDRIAPLKGIARFKLLRLSPHLELYLSPLNFHPDCHPIAFSWPPDYSGALAHRFGLFKTLGWPEDTWSLPSGVGDEALFLEDMAFTLAKDEQILTGLLSDHADDLYVQVFYFTDRIGHLFWRYLDPGHPLYDAEAARRFAPEVLKAYQRMDALVGKARQLAGPDALFLVCSDHGFSSFRRGFNINTWLVKNGFMTIKGRPGDPATLEKLFDTHEILQNVDWSRTKAYSLGFGGIFVNLAGRERQGSVLPGADYENVRRQIRAGLESLVDPGTGAHPVSRVWTREEIYTAFDPDLTPDLRLGNAANYRISWQASLGAAPPELFEDNRKAWSGDHCSNDPDLVRGVFFSNRKLAKVDPAMIDIAPSVLQALGLTVPREMDGKPLF
jgi:predicted AlkP superfamily phosphohydrolase/phosphomutase